MDENFDVRLEGWIDVRLSNCPRIKTMYVVCIKEWTTYIGVVMK
jgi:hypothetical protein